MLVIGDRVRCVREDPTNPSVFEEAGTVIAVSNIISNRYGVVFDNHVDGHNMEGMCKDGHGWWIGEMYLELISEAYDLPEFTEDELLALFV